MFLQWIAVQLSELRIRRKNRGLYSSKTEIRHKIFTEIARMAYEGQSPEMLEELPYKIVPGEIATYRDSIFLERAVVGERLRVAMGCH
mgnify:CR=1 FL=1